MTRYQQNGDSQGRIPFITATTTMSHWVHWGPPIQLLAVIYHALIFVMILYDCAGDKHTTTTAGQDIINSRYLHPLNFKAIRKGAL